MPAAHPCRARVLPALCAAVLAGLFAAGTARGQGQPGAGQTAPPPAVTTVPVQNRDVAPATEFIGRIEAIRSFDARPRIEGTVEQVAFQEGQEVHEGDLLYVIEPAPYQAALDSAEASLASAEARLREAERAYNRAEELRQRGNVSQAQLDQALADRDAAQADVMMNRAQVRTAEINLGYTRIASPVDGRIGATAVTQGNLVNPATGVLATVVQLDPIRVVFSVADRDMLAFQRRFDVSRPAQAAEKYVPTLILPDGSEYAEQGQIEFANNRVDPQTGTVSIRATFANPQRLLLPGQYVTVQLRRDQTVQRPVVPVASIQQDQQGSYVLVLDDQNRVQRRPVETGAQVDQSLVVEKGLTAGETVVVGGAQKVRPGMVVQPTPAEQMADRTQAGASPSPAGAAGSSGAAPANGAGSGSGAAKE
ncbi:efflux RND transporter periplasmic adaptor subunit [Azospirillum lipoferum]|uniref:RND efflux transporter, MFP subunit n=1 Tax=Azospirillum lipoferum (strain 4B) TaxID=862719 RepID=G7ZAV3_AZOL4|nr:efflux RND transporter periplasmic adaptor subunit [Azospirillum lipoferum]CBS89027.1 RND efflux transporter, MFP subunit [Azospirillum lipoferum 4B]